MPNVDAGLGVWLTPTGYEVYELNITEDAYKAFLHVQRGLRRRRTAQETGAKRAAGIEPARLGWKPRALPLSYARAHIA